MNIILLSGGSGKRLWPLSNDIRSKQFIKIFKKEDGTYESMVERVYRQIKAVDPDANVTVATSKSQVSVIHNQLGMNVGISVEPSRRDTFPAIALSCAYLTDVKGVSPDETVVICPVDPFVEYKYFEALKTICDHAAESDANLVLMGIEPTAPSEKFGYIIPQSQDAISRVSTFKEKPIREVAEEYIKQGALWNGGVFSCKLSYILSRAHDLIDFENYKDLYAKYDTLNKISFDYAVVEQEKRIDVVRFSGLWRDLGTWSTLTDAMSEKIVGEGVIGDKCENVHILNEMNLPVLTMGVSDVVVAVSPEGILVSDKQSADYIKPYVEKISSRVMFAEKSWGSFRILDAGESWLTVKVTLNAGHSMNYHSHSRRDELWTVVEGEGYAIIDDTEIRLGIGSVIRIPRGARHTVFAFTELKLIEVQTGDEISVSDKQKFPLPEKK